ncbi:hydroxymethylglutaryl-CoA reductase, degradative [Flavobacteriaceae bacterium]|jgi:hydroxymethylglutaryl-CoA reductase|nr:hydroxymethylglutaryl-CoA reductase, degradative [Flavobacteriaceae bacterium]MDB4213101.1 hydroxymethylglutaryl-CoA reductase, degradative [Flavobacteriaceae bacterium]|tara:strand:+ start:91 stop:1401 length:1311 start_codon:yes stop_codon:yes gene_type:complete
MKKPISGFSKLNKSEKIEWLLKNSFSSDNNIKSILLQYCNSNEKLQKLHDEFAENTISNFYLPFAIAPNFLINNKPYTIPMVTEESSVIAAASKSAKFWLERGGFKATVLSTTKVGQVHLIYKGNFKILKKYFEKIKPKLISDVSSITANMNKRGGGIKSIELLNFSDKIENYFQIKATFDTHDAMGANFINSCLEQFSKTFKDNFKDTNEIEIIMSILSNYVPECIVKAEVCCEVDLLSDSSIINPLDFANKFVRAVKIAEVDKYRAVTHNKGIMNGIDSVVIATGNDFRAIESAAHAYASRSGNYKSLTKASVEKNIFKFSIEIPLALGTVGGLTKLHPLANLALELLDNPNSRDLMKITAVAGLAQNFAAIKSLITTGIQHGHMKMHLINILNQLKASEKEKEKAVEYFKTNMVSYLTVDLFVNKLRSNGKIL